jgi:hypothetical protein
MRARGPRPVTIASPFEHQKRRPTWQSLVAFFAFVALGHYDHDGAILVVAVPMGIVAVNAMVRRRITTRGKRGPWRTYEGSAAVSQAAFFLLMSLVLGGYAAHNIWLRNR